MIRSPQFRAARSGLRLNLDEVSTQTGISRATLQRIEGYDDFSSLTTSAAYLEKLEAFYIKNGITFIDNGIIFPSKK